MKTPLLRSVVIVLVMAFHSSSFAFSDSAKNETGNKVNPVHTKTMNVVYPALLKGSEKHSIEYVRKFAQTRREYLLRTFNKGKKYFPKIEVIFRKFHLPQELKVLIALESGFNGNAVSSAGAVGFWQIMDPVAKEYGLRIAGFTKTKKSKKPARPMVDERKNFAKSTYVAARYLKDRCRNLDNDYLLIVASYNWGVGNVWNAMQKTGLASPTFWDIKKYLPSETRAYVMNFIALNVIFHNYDKFAKNNLVFSGALPAESNDCAGVIGPLPHIETYF